MERLAPGTRVETAHGRHHALETGVIVRHRHHYDLDLHLGWESDWYEVEMDCGCCRYSLDVRSDGYGRIRVAR